MTAFLECNDLHVSYGQVEVLFGVDLEISQGEMVALLGVNGAGKSTVLRAICGLIQPTKGSIKLGQYSALGHGPERIAEAGVMMVPGGRGVFPTLTVGENLQVAGWLSRKDPSEFAREKARVLQMFPVLEDRIDQIAGNLSGGEQQMLTLSQAFINRPQILMIDELSLGLAPVIVAQLIDVVKAINAAGTTVILVEQSINLALDLCQRAVFMERGEVRFDGPSADLLNHPELLRAVFLEGVGPSSGEKPVTVLPTTSAVDIDNPTISDPEIHPNATRARAPFRLDGADIALETKNISVRFGGIKAIDDVSIQLHQGEVLGIIGANGAGKTTFFDLISGFITPDTGQVILDGLDVTQMNPEQRAARRLGRSFQDALLFPSLTIRETIAVSLERHIEVRDPISSLFSIPIARRSEKEVYRKVDQLIELMGLGPFVHKFLSELSTGTRRLVDIACSLAHDPKVLMLDEPAAGVAQKEVEALGPLLLRIRDETGASLLIVEHDMPLIKDVADRVVVLDAGSQLASGTPDEVMSNPVVIAAYLGGDPTAIARSGSGDRLARVGAQTAPGIQQTGGGVAGKPN